MPKVIFAFCILFILAGCKTELTFPNGTCITNVNIIDARQGLREKMTVVIRDNIIVKVGKTQSLKLAASNTIIDGSGKYLIPGLWDAHVHFAYIEELAPSMFDLFLSYGVTSVRDTGGKIDFVKKWKDNALANSTRAPRVKIAGPLLDGMPNVYDGSLPTRPPLSVGAGTVSEAVSIVDFLDSAGVDLIKAYEMLTPEQFKAVAQRAKEKGLKVTGHVPLSMDVITASDLGLGSMEHMRNLEMSCAANADELLQERRKMLAAGSGEAGGTLRSNIHNAQRNNAVLNQDKGKTKEVLDVLARNQTWQIPTLSIITAMSKRPFIGAEWQESFKYLPPEVEQSWRAAILSVEHLEVTEAQRRYTDWGLNMIGQINEAGIGIMAGTDCPIFFLTPGRSLHEELALLVESGLTPLEAIEAATLKPAMYFNMDHELGLIQEGMLADLVLLDANPLEDIHNTLEINAVIRDGHIHDRSDLDVILKKLDTGE